MTPDQYALITVGALVVMSLIVCIWHGRIQRKLEFQEALEDVDDIEEA